MPFDTTGVTNIPSDSNGVYSLPTGYLAATGETIQASQHNPPLEDLASAMSVRLMRTGAAPMTGPLKIVDGSVGSPSIQFNSAGTTGFYKTASGFGISVNGAKVAEFSSSGVSGARYIGELIPWTLTAAPSLCVLPYGQTLSRTTYADLWTVAQVEIAAGNAWYNNGDGSTTFGIGDMRGCTIAAKDNMGGTAAGRLSTYFSGGTSTQLGSRAGSQNTLLGQANLPNVAPSFSGNAGTVNVLSNRGDIGFGSDPISVSSGDVQKNSSIGQISSSGSFTPSGSVSSINGGQTQTAFANVQPTIICNFALFAGA